MTALTPNKNLHYCKMCGSDFIIKISTVLQGDVLLECPSCGKLHSRQFELGVAVSCNAPTTSNVKRIKGEKC